MLKKWKYKINKKKAVVLNISKNQNFNKFDIEIKFKFIEFKNEF